MWGYHNPVRIHFGAGWLDWSSPQEVVHPYS